MTAKQFRSVVWCNWTVADLFTFFRCYCISIEKVFLGMTPQASHISIWIFFLQIPSRCQVGWDQWRTDMGRQHINKRQSLLSLRC